MSNRQFRPQQRQAVGDTTDMDLPAYSALNPIGCSTPRPGNDNQSITTAVANHNLDITANKNQEKGIGTQLLMNRYAYHNLTLAACFIILCTNLALLVVCNNLYNKINISQTEINQKLDLVVKANALDPNTIIDAIDSAKSSQKHDTDHGIKLAKEEIIASVRNGSHTSTSKITDMGNSCVGEQNELRTRLTEMTKEFNKLRQQTQGAVFVTPPPRACMPPAQEDRSFSKFRP